MVMVTMMVNVCDDDCYLVMKVILVKEVMSCDVLPVAMFTDFRHAFDWKKTSETVFIYRTKTSPQAKRHKTSLL